MLDIMILPLCFGLLCLHIQSAESISFENRNRYANVCKISQCCIAATLCRSIAQQLTLRRHPVICGWYGRIPLVCCEKSESNEETSTLTDENVTPRGIAVGDSNQGTAVPQGIGINSESNTNRFNRISPAGCGVREVIYSISVAGGKPAVTPWPWMVAIFDEVGQNHLCGGALIDNKHILTAAHCFADRSNDPKDYTVIVGEISISDPASKIKIEALQIHEKYDSRYYYYDIALLRLAESLDDKTPICLPATDNIQPGDDCAVLGWGDLFYGGPSSKVLQVAYGIPIVANDQCNYKYSSISTRNFPRGITEDFLCAGLTEGGKDSCQGDSGGPLLYQTEDDTWMTVGIVSFGYECANGEYPGVYSRVSAYIPWIESNVLQYQKENNNNFKAIYGRRNQY